MRLKGYLHLNEGAIKQGFEFDELASAIKKDCKPYLSIVRKFPHPFVRAMKPPIGSPDSPLYKPSELKTKEDVENFENNLDNFYKAQALANTGLMAVRQDRKARLTPDDVAKMVNDWLEKQGGARRDKSVIAISKLSSVHKTFGMPHWIFPVGKFKYSFVMSDDFNITTGVWDPFDFFQFLRGKGYKDSKDFEPYFYHNTHAEKAAREEWEIWFQCKKYYYINTEIQGIPRFVKAMGMVWEW